MHATPFPRLLLFLLLPWTMAAEPLKLVTFHQVDNYNTVHPADALNTRRVRIVMTPRDPDSCVGVLSVEIEGVE